MPKKTKAGPSAAAPASEKAPAASNPVFPELSPKEDLQCQVLIEDQILLIDELFSVEECKRFIKFIEGLPLELTPPKKRGEASRVNYRISVNSPHFAQRLHAIITPHLPTTFPSPTSAKRSAVATAPRAPHSLNRNIRMYKYVTDQYFGAHYDDSVRDLESGTTSEWTLLIYLSGEEDGVGGGQTLFYRERRGQPTETITPPLKRGMALLHRHGKECMLHEGAPVAAGTKYVLRSDLMFR